MTQTKKTVISIYCHYTGFSAILLEKITADTDFDSWQSCEKRWTVSKIIRDIPSYELISKALTELKALNRNSDSVLINSEIDLRKKLKNSSISFKKEIKDSKSISSSSENLNTNIFHLIALVNDKHLAFKKECSELIEEIKFFNPANHSNDINALLLAINNIPYDSINYLLTS